MDSEDIVFVINRLSAQGFFVETQAPILERLDRIIELLEVMPGASTMVNAKGRALEAARRQVEPKENQDA